MCDKIVKGKECADGQCKDRHSFKRRNYRTDNECTWGIKCEFLHITPNTTEAFIDDKVEEASSTVVLDCELELGSGGFGSDILERDATAVEEVVDGDHHVMGGEKTLGPSGTTDVLDLAFKDAGGETLSMDYLDMILESFEGK